MNDQLRARLATTESYRRVVVEIPTSECAEWVADFYSVRELRRMSDDALDRAIGEAVYRRCTIADVHAIVRDEIRQLMTRPTTADPDQDQDRGNGYSGPTTIGEVPSVFNTGPPPDPPSNPDPDQDPDGEGTFEPMDTVTTGSDQ